MKKFAQTFTVLLLTGFLQACVTAPPTTPPLDLSAYQTAHLEVSSGTSLRPEQAKWIDADVRQELKNRRLNEFDVAEIEDAEVAVKVTLLQVRGPYSLRRLGSGVLGQESRVKAMVEVTDARTGAVLGSEEFNGISKGTTGHLRASWLGSMRTAVRTVSLQIATYLSGTPSAPAEVEGHATSAPSPGD